MLWWYYFIILPTMLCFCLKQIMVKIIESDDKATFFLPLSSRTDLVMNILDVATNNLHKSVFITLHERFITHGKIFDQAEQLRLWFVKYILLYIFYFLFYLVLKIFSKMCFLTRKSGEKECILQSD